MKVLIFEDERLSAERLTDLLKRYDPGIKVLDIIDSVKKGIEWFINNPSPELIFMDIRLADSVSFELFEKVNIEAPVIFTTAYDEYALKAFKVNSIDYLVKPYDFNDLKKAIDKFKKLKPVFSGDFLKYLFNQADFYKKRFLVKVGDQLKHLDILDIAYFKSEDSLVFAFTKNKSSLPMDYSLDQLESSLDPSDFFRINRQYLVNIGSIGRIHTYFNGRLKIELNPPPPDEVIVSREKSSAFKKWLGA